ncbi:MAG TPA: hypothetical protein VH438_15955 [Gemmatimonadales bacterium]
MSKIPPVESQVTPIPMEITTVAAQLMTAGPVPHVSANFAPVRAKLMAIQANLVAIPAQLPPLMHFHPPLAKGSLRSDRLGVEFVANRQDEYGGQADGYASHRFLSVMSESTVPPNHERKTLGPAPR